jgi:hypothetical protein
MKRYILNESGDPVEESDIFKWSQWLNETKRRVALDERDGVRVSTIFLGTDYSYNGDDPVFWETMIFGGEFSEEQERCGGSRKDAEAMHARIIAKVFQTKNVQ